MRRIGCETFDSITYLRGASTKVLNGRIGSKDKKSCGTARIIIDLSENENPVGVGRGVLLCHPIHGSLEKKEFERERAARRRLFLERPEGDEVISNADGLHGDVVLVDVSEMMRATFLSFCR